MKERDSNFELLRIVAMFCIIFYHLLSYFITPVTNDAVYKALEIPFHCGVLLFVLISGYYGIKTSLRGVIKLILPILFFYVPIELIAHLKGGGSLWGGDKYIDVCFSKPILVC